LATSSARFFHQYRSATRLYVPSFPLWPLSSWAALRILCAISRRVHLGPGAKPPYNAYAFHVGFFTMDSVRRLARGTRSRVPTHTHTASYLPHHSPFAPWPATETVTRPRRTGCFTYSRTES